jgi:hypothetical protein
MELSRLIYTSQAKEEFSKRNLLDLLHESRTFNALDNITGVLMYKEGRFLQVIEGESDVVNDLFTRILRDQRHKKVKLHYNSSINSRLFSNWAMGCAYFNQPKLSLIPGILKDLNDSKIMEDLILPITEIGTFFHEKLD